MARLPLHKRILTLRNKVILPLAPDRCVDLLDPLDLRDLLLPARTPLARAIQVLGAEVLPLNPRANLHGGSNERAPQYQRRLLPTPLHSFLRTVMNANGFFHLALCI